MITNGWNALQLDRLTTLMQTSHTIHIVVQLLDINHNYINDLTPYFYDGQVNFDTQTEISRSLDLTLIDVLGTSQMDPNSSSPSSLYIAYMIRIIVQVIDPVTNEIFSIPVFTGPIDDVDTDGPFISIKALGKESLAQGGVLRAKTYRGKPNISRVMINVFADVLGEKKYDIPKSTKTSQKPIHLNMETKTWSLLKALANDLGLNLFYDGRGVAVARPQSNIPRWSFNNSNMASLPKFGFDMNNVCNAARITGGRSGKKDKTKPRVTVYPPANHPLNPWSPYLKRGGRPRFINPVEFTDESLDTQQEVKDRGRKFIDNAILSAAVVTMDAWPVYFLEEFDVAEISTGSASQHFRMTKWALPLTASGDMPVGYLRRTSIKAPMGKRGDKGKKGNS